MPSPCLDENCDSIALTYPTDLPHLTIMNNPPENIILRCLVYWTKGSEKTLDNEISLTYLLRTPKSMHLRSHHP